MPHFEETFANLYELGTPLTEVNWGDIGGTLSDQLDLQAALDAKLDDSQASAFGLSLLGSADAAAAQILLALVPGTNVQAWDADLDALAGLATAADTLPYFTGSHAAALTTLTAFGRSLIDDANALTARATLGLVIGTDVQAWDAELQAIAGLTSAADRLPYFTGSGTAALATFTAGGRALVNSAGTADTFPYFSASNTVTLGSITAFGRSLIDDATAADARTTLGLGSGDSPTFAALTVSGLSALASVTISSTLGVTGLSTLASIVDTGSLQATKISATSITPVWQMHGAGTLATANSAQGWFRWTADANPASQIFSKSRGAAIGTHTIVNDADTIGRTSFSGSDGVAFFEAARISAVVQGAPAVGSVPGALVFSTTAVGAGAPTTAFTLNADSSAAFAAHVNAPTTMVIGNTSAIPNNTRVLIDRLGTSSLPTLSGGTVLTLAGSNASGNNAFLQLVAGSAGIAAVRFGDTGAAGQGRIDYDHATDSFSFYTAGSSQLTLSSGGVLSAAGAFNAASGAFNTTTLRAFNSGGSVTPVLQVNGTASATSSLGLAVWSGTPTAPTLALGYSAGAAVGTHTVVADTNVLGRLSFDGSDGTAFIEAARIEAFVNGTPGTNDMPGGLKFYTTPDGSATPAVALTIGQDKGADFAGALSAVGVTSTARMLVNYASGVLGIATTADAQACGTFLYSNGSSSGNRRWGIVKSADAESGSNVGSEFEIWRYSDAGSLLGTALSIARATGLVTLSSVITGDNIYNTYTPTLTGITNVSASSANVSGWIRIGNAVLVFARISVTATAATANTVIDISLPVASNFGSATQCVGVGSVQTTGTEVAGVAISANITSDVARATFVSSATGARNYQLVFGYIVI